MASAGNDAFVSHPQRHRRRSTDVLDHSHRDVGHVEDLPALGADDLGPQPGATPGACPREMVHHLVGIGHLGQMFALATRLLPGRRPPLAARPGWAAWTTLRLTAASTSCGDYGRDVVQIAILASRAAMSVACFSVTRLRAATVRSLLIRGRVIERGVVVRWNSHVTRCFPRWWIAGSGDLNSYENTIIRRSFTPLDSRGRTSS